MGYEFGIGFMGYGLGLFGFGIGFMGLGSVYVHSGFLEWFAFRYMCTQGS